MGEEEWIAPGAGPFIDANYRGVGRSSATGPDSFLSFPLSAFIPHLFFSFFFSSSSSASPSFLWVFFILSLGPRTVVHTHTHTPSFLSFSPSYSYKLFYLFGTRCSSHAILMNASNLKININKSNGGGLLSQPS